MTSQPSNRPGGAKPLVFIVLAFVVLLLSWWGITTLSQAKPETKEQAGGSGGFPPANVVLAPVEMRLSVQTHRVIGTLRARARSEIAARESGAVFEILVNEGDAIEKGAVIARIDPRRLEAQIAEAKAASTAAMALVQQREAERERCSTDLIMKERLYKEKALSESEVLDARRSASVAAALVDAAEDSFRAADARLDLVKIRSTDLEILAPFTGRIVERHVELGEWVNLGDSIVTLVSSGEAEAWLQVPERFATAVKGKSVSIKLTASGQTFTSQNLIVVPEANASSRTLQMVAVLPDPDNVLVPGFSVSADLPVTEERKRLAVPVNAVVQSYSGPGVFVPLEKEGSPLPVAQRVSVKVHYQDAGYVYISSESLSENDRVIVEGNERLFPYQPIVIQEVKKDKPLSKQ